MKKVIGDDGGELMRVQAKFPKSLVRKLDGLAKREPDNIGRSEMLRRLVERASKEK